MGLSPRVRGNRARRGEGTASHRSIPACAGEPIRRSALVFQQRVYPRVCGGTGLKWQVPEWAIGLSPRVRGNPPGRPSAKTATGSIPACAGEPVPTLSPPPTPTVYPRVCGGTPRFSTRASNESGLSPRVRGNRRVGSGLRVGRRSIPACAGEPCLHRQYGRGCAVYPRVCGGTFAPIPGYKYDQGLSPRVRGNRDVGRPLRRGRGSIPACAGEPVL